MKLSQTGSLDSSYGTGGRVKVQIGVNSQAFSAALDSTAKLVVAGFAQPSPTDPANGFVLRLGTNGALDSTFHQTGIVLWPSPGSDVAFTKVIAEPFTDDVITSGTQLSLGSGSFIVAKFRPNGTVDTGFGDLKP